MWKMTRRTENDDNIDLCLSGKHQWHHRGDETQDELCPKVYIGYAYHGPYNIYNGGRVKCSWAGLCLEF